MKKSFFDVERAKALLPARRADGNKGTFGRVLIVCGSRNMVGCCVLAAEGALRSGAGLVQVAFPDVLYIPLTSQLTETLFLPLETAEDGTMSHLALPHILEAADAADIVVAGCGMGTGYGPHLITTSLISTCKTPLVLDADALNCLEGCAGFLNNADGQILLTPHPGEMSRLTGKSIAEIQADRENTVSAFCKEHGVSLLLKGQNTVICDSSGETLSVNLTGNNGLSKGGSGDLLAGIIGGLGAQMNGDLFGAACLGAYVHGLTADILKENTSVFSMLPSDCAKTLGEAFFRIENS